MIPLLLGALRVASTVARVARVAGSVGTSSQPGGASITFSAKVHGLDELRRALRNVPIQLRRNILRGAIRAGAMIVADDARRRVPTRSGQLRSSIRVSVRAKGNIVKGTISAGDSHRVFKGRGAVNKKAAYKSVGPTGRTQYHAAFYTGFVEFGTKPHAIKSRRPRGVLVIGSRFVKTPVRHPGSRPHPFLKPALTANEPRVLAAIADYAGRRVQALNKGA